MDRLLHYLPASRYVSPYDGNHVLLTAARMVALQADNFAYRQSVKFLFAGLAVSAEAESRGVFLRHALSREQVLTQEVLDFGRNSAHWTRYF